MSIMNIQKGNPYSAPIEITNSDGTAYDLTGKTVYFTMKRISDYTDNDDGALIKKKITVHTDAIGGITTLTLTAADTIIKVGDYKGDVRVYALGVIQANSETFTIKVSDIVTKINS